MNQKRIRRTKVIVAYVLMAALILTSLLPNVRVFAATEITITEAAGWFESAYVEWSPVPDAKQYNVYIKKRGEADAAYKQLDDMLIRRYADYYRADALGLAEESYIMKVEAVLSDGYNFCHNLRTYSQCL